LSHRFKKPLQGFIEAVFFYYFFAFFGFLVSFLWELFPFAIQSG